MNKKIVIFGDDPTGPTGFGKIVKHLAAAVIAAGCEPVVVGLKKHYDYPVPGARIINTLDNDDPRGFDTLRGVLKTKGIDLVISIGDPWDIQGLPLIKQQHAFTWIGYTPVDSTPYPRYLLLTKDPHQYLDVAFLMQQMDHIVTYAGFGKTAVEEMLIKACTEEPLRMEEGSQTIYLGVDPDLYRPQAKSKACKLFQGAMTDDMLLFSCMKVNSIRAGFDTLFAAWSAYLSLAADFDPALAERSKLYLHTAIDNGGYPISLLMQRYGLENSIMLNPGIKPGECFSEEVIAATHNASDIVVSAARGEGFGLNILEALSCAVPCIVPDYGCPAEYGGGSVWRVPIAATFNPEFATTDFAIVDKNEMAAGMFALARDPGKRTRMGNIGREIAKTLTWQTFIEKWATMIESVLRRN
ncbi:MAG: glycosyltransferase family 4 protein [Desulfobacterales bacterium]|nr:glycosyltransferase family 4 protein [Desulfobacterales bacterium]